MRADTQVGSLPLANNVKHSPVMNDVTRRRPTRSKFNHSAYNNRLDTIPRIIAIYPGGKVYCDTGSKIIYAEMLEYKQGSASGCISFAEE